MPFVVSTSKFLPAYANIRYTNQAVHVYGMACSVFFLILFWQTIQCSVQTVIWQSLV